MVCARACSPFIPLSKSFFSHLLDSLMTLIHCQTWINRPWLIDRFITVLFDLFDRVLSALLHDECTLLLELIDIFLKKAFVSLILVQQ